MPSIRTLISATYIALAVTLSSCAPAPGMARTVNIEGGTIQGTYSEGIATFLGIPYAAPPTGNLRWKAPKPVIPWTGSRECAEFGPACPQGSTYLYNIGNQNEDCLYLNIWSPAKTAGDRLPVMVWIHGGSFATGTAAQPMYNGRQLASKGVVVVTINYRLGPLGFLSHPLLSKESEHGVSGNYGLLDQVAALKWVQHNITKFGGDPGLVTIFGESAGAMSVIDLMVSPLAAGLFQRAISQSGAFSDAIPNAAREDTVAMAEKSGLEIAARLGCDKAGDPLTAMRQKTAAEIIRAAYDGYSVNSGLRYRPVVDGWIIPYNPWSMFTDGRQQKVPLLIGTNADESTIFVLPDPNVRKMSLDDYRSFVKTLYPNASDEALSLFPSTSKADVLNAVIKLRTIMGFAAGALHAADTTDRNGSAVYMYLFTRVPDTWLKIAGAFHGLEIFYLFGNMHGERVLIPDDRADLELSGRIQQYWTNFARNGDPNFAGLPNWPAYKVGEGKYLVLDNPVTRSYGLYDDYYGLIRKVTPP